MLSRILLRRISAMLSGSSTVWPPPFWLCTSCSSRLYLPFQKRHPATPIPRRRASKEYPYEKG